MTRAFAIASKEPKQDLLSGSLVIEKGIRREFEKISTTRIVMSVAGQAKLRFYTKGNEFVSKRQTISHLPLVRLNDKLSSEKNQGVE